MKIAIGGFTAVLLTNGAVVILGIASGVLSMLHPIKKVKARFNTTIFFVSMVCKEINKNIFRLILSVTDLGNQLIFRKYHENSTGLENHSVYSNFGLKTTLSCFTDSIFSLE